MISKNVHICVLSALTAFGASSPSKGSIPTFARLRARSNELLRPDTDGKGGKK